MYVPQFSKRNMDCNRTKDVTRIYDVKLKTMTIKQGTKTITEYASKLKALWMRLDHYSVI